MCDICLKSPCDPRCPNSHDPPIVFVCSGCGRYIHDGDDYWEFLGEQFCERCVDNARQEAVYDPE